MPKLATIKQPESLSKMAYEVIRQSILSGQWLVGELYNEKAIVYHRARETFTGFLKQSFWYGFGRKELALRHGTLARYDRWRGRTAQFVFIAELGL